MPPSSDDRPTPRKSARQPKGDGAGALLSREGPHSVDAEEGLLASCMLDTEGLALNECMRAKLSPEAFFKRSHQIIYSGLLELQRQEKPPDELLLSELLRDNGELESIGGMAEIDRILDRIDTPVHARHWLEIVINKWHLRRLIATATNVVQQCYEQPSSLAEFLEEVEQQVFSISNERVVDSAISFPDVVDKAVMLVQMMSSRGNDRVTGVSTGLIDVDGMTYGLQKSDMIVLAARPSMGKTSLAMNIAENAALPTEPDRKKARVLVFSLEMNAEQLGMRMLCARARVDMRRIRDGFASSEEIKRIAVAAKELKQASIHIDDSSNLNIYELRAKARRIHAKSARDGGLDLVVIDYLQLISGSRDKPSREQEISEISRGIKAMAKELEAPVLVLSQLNRESEREKRQPRLSDLRESGSIEQDADVVMMLARARDSGGDDEAEIPQAANARELIIAKQRNGPVGSVPLTFMPEHTRFDNHMKEQPA